MSISIAIVGLPNVGKSTLFNAITDNNILVANYPFATIEPNNGIVPVPDDRLSVLSEIYKAQKIIPATVEFTDIAGLVAGASKGEGLGNQFLSHIRVCSAIIQVVRAFDSGDVIRSESSHDPAHDIGVVNSELILADLQTIEKRLTRLEKEVRANPKLSEQLNTLKAINNLLNQDKPLWSDKQLLKDYHEQLYELQLMTGKPILYLFNVDELGLSGGELKTKLAEMVAPSPALFVCAKLEDELRALDESDRNEMLLSYGQVEPGLFQVIRAAYQLLGLQSYLTAGEKEVRAWTIKKGSTAPQAAGVIHGDFERGFISAQIVSYPDLVAAGSEANAKSSGKMRTEGKTYIMQPDDIVEFRFNV